MSDAPQGEGWWQASDGKWYPPEQASGAQPAAGGGAVGGGGLKLDIGAALSFGWQRFTQNVASLLLLLLAIVGVTVVFYIMAFFIGSAVDSFFVGFILQITISFIGLALAFIIGRGLIRIVLDLCDGKPVEAGKLFDFSNIGPYAIAAILYSVIVGVGYMLCVIPGIIAAVLLWFWAFAQVDGDRAPVDALKASYELVMARPGEVILFIIVANLVNFAGSLLCGIGLFVTIPVTMIASGYAWRTLNGRPVAT